MRLSEGKEVMNTKTIVNYRNVWMGIAMLYVVFFHSSFSLPHVFFEYIKELGYCGVDICIFASGIGCYYSLSKDSDVLGFYKRRIMRIFSTYWCFIIFWIVFKLFTNPITFREIVGNVFGIQTFTGYGTNFNWYISGILILYLLAPIFKLIIDKNNIKTNVFCVLVLIIISFAFWQTGALLMIATRVPLFFVGMVFGHFCRNKNK